jgi:hypothetical protein
MLLTVCVVEMVLDHQVNLRNDTIVMFVHLTCVYLHD